MDQDVSHIIMQRTCKNHVLRTARFLFSEGPVSVEQNEWGLSLADWRVPVPVPEAVSGSVLFLAENATRGTVEHSTLPYPWKALDSQQEESVQIYLRHPIITTKAMAKHSTDQFSYLITWKQRSDR